MKKKKRTASSKSGNGAAKTTRVFLRQWLNILITFAVLIAAFIAMAFLWNVGLLDGWIGSVTTVLLGIVGVTCLFDLAMLLTECVTVSDGMVNAGKNDAGDLMLFHADSVDRIELRDRQGQVVPEVSGGKYKRVRITFVMNSGRINQRKESRVNQSRLDELRRVISDR